jgi:hypothetical protein
MHPAFNLVERLCEVPYGEALMETPTSFVALPVTLTRVFLSSLVSSTGALADNSSAEISSKKRSGCVPEGSGVSLVVMKTCRSGEPRMESVVATSVGVCYSTADNGVPS